MLTLYEETPSSRPLLGMAAYPTLEILKQFVQIAQLTMVTVSSCRAGSDDEAHEQDFWSLLEEVGVLVLPSTVGCQSVQETVTAAQMTREVFDTDWTKPGLVGDGDTLQPDVLQPVEVAGILIKDGLKVLPYCIEDLIACRRLFDAGYQMLVPRTTSIGMGLDAIHAYALKVLRERLPDTLLTIDAGLGLSPQAAQVMGRGFNGVLPNTAVSCNSDPVNAARASVLAVRLGRLVYEVKSMEVREKAYVSTPTMGQPSWYSAGY